jgi:hypothetical protein
MEVFKRRCDTSLASTPIMTSIPKVQTAVVITSKDEDLQIRKDYPVKQPDELAPGECLVRILATGVCQSGTSGCVMICVSETYDNEQIFTDGSTITLRLLSTPSWAGMRVSARS